MIATSPVEKFEFRNDSSSASGLMTFTVDWPKGIMRCLSTGFWSLKQSEEHFRFYVACVREIHRRGLPALIVVDLRDADAQSQEVAETIRSAVDGLYKPGDRIAMVVESSVTKIQMRRVLQPEYHEYFLSLNAAQHWAFAHHPKT